MSCSNSCLLSLLSNCPVWKLLQCVTVIMKKTKTSAYVSISWQRVMSIRAWGCRDTCDICRLCQGCTCWCWRSGRCPEVTATYWKEALFLLESSALDRLRLLLFTCVSLCVFKVSRAPRFCCVESHATEVRCSQEKSQLVEFRGVLVYPSLNSYNLDVCVCASGVTGVVVTLSKWVSELKNMHWSTSPMPTG